MARRSEATYFLATTSLLLGIREGIHTCKYRYYVFVYP